MSAGLVLTARRGLLYVERVHRGRFMMWRRAVQAGSFRRLRNTSSSGLKSQDRDFRWVSVGFCRLRIANVTCRDRLVRSYE